MGNKNSPYHPYKQNTSQQEQQEQVEKQKKKQLKLKKKVSKQSYKTIETLQKQSNSIKNKTHATIKHMNLKEHKKIVRLFRVDPHEELSVKGYYWCALHYAAHFKANQILEFLIKVTYHIYPDQFIEIMNVKTKEGWTPAMIAAIYKSDQALEILLKYGGIDLHTADSNERSITDLATYYRSTSCLALIQQKLGQVNSSGLLEPNYELLNSIEPLEVLFQDSMPEQNNGSNGTVSNEVNGIGGSEIKNQQLMKEAMIDLEKYRELLLKGDRVPCIICLSDYGYIKYTTCCGQPIHGPCNSEKFQKCPYCNVQKYELTSEIFYPERAFVLPNNQIEQQS